DAIGKVGAMLASEKLTRALLGLAPTAETARAQPAQRPAAAVTSDVDVLPAARAARPHSYAVVVGVEHYREKLPNADFAASDAKLAARYFERVLGVPEAN